MDIIEELQNYRTQLIQEINVTFDRMIQKIRSEETTEHIENGMREYELSYPLTASTGFFKGKKPLAVVFKDGTRVDAFTWKKVVESVLQYCNTTGNKHNELASLCGKVSGRDRVLLATKEDNMRSAIKVDEGIFMESHYDTESLLRIMVTRILAPIRFDYEGINIIIRNDDI